MTLQRGWLGRFIGRVTVLVTAADVVTATADGTAYAVADDSGVRDGAFEFVVDLEARGIPAVGGGTRDSACSAARVAQNGSSAPFTAFTTATPPAVHLHPGRWVRVARCPNP